MNGLAAVHSYRGLLLLSEKGTNHWHMQQTLWISRQLCWEEKGNPKTLNTVWFHSITLLKMTSFRHDKSIEITLMITRSWEDMREFAWLSKGNRKDLYGVKNILYLTVSVTVSWLWYCIISTVLQHVIIGKNWVKGK